MKLQQKYIGTIRLAIEFKAASEGLVGNLPHGKGYLGEYLQKGATRLLFNIIKGSCVEHRHERNHFFCTALKSARECSAILHAFLQLKHINPYAGDFTHTLLLRVIQSINRNIEEKDSDEEPRVMDLVQFTEISDYVEEVGGREKSERVKISLTSLCLTA